MSESMGVFLLTSKVGFFLPSEASITEKAEEAIIFQTTDKVYGIVAKLPRCPLGSH